MCSSSKLLVRLSPQGKKWGKLFGFSLPSMNYVPYVWVKRPLNKNFIYFNSYIAKIKLYQVVFFFYTQTVIILYFSGLIILPILGEVVGMELKELAAEHKKHLGPVQILRYQQMDRKILRGMASSLMT